MVKRTTSSSSRIQHTLPREDSEAVSSVFWGSVLDMAEILGFHELEKVFVSFNCVRKRILAKEKLMPTLMERGAVDFAGTRRAYLIAATLRGLPSLGRPSFDFTFTLHTACT